MKSKKPVTLITDAYNKGNIPSFFFAKTEEEKMISDVVEENPMVYRQMKLRETEPLLHASDAVLNYIASIYMNHVPNLVKNAFKAGFCFAKTGGVDMSEMTDDDAELLDRSFDSSDLTVAEFIADHYEKAILIPLTDLMNVVDKKRLAVGSAVKILLNIKGVSDKDGMRSMEGTGHTVQLLKSLVFLTTLHFALKQIIESMTDITREDGSFMSGETDPMDMVDEIEKRRKDIMNDVDLNIDSDLSIEELLEKVNGIVRNKDRDSDNE